jgi:hypothetical protein
MAMVVLALGGGSILYFLSTLAFLLLGILFIFGSNRFQGGQSAPREGQDDDLAAKVLGDEEAQELHRRRDGGGRCAGGPWNGGANRVRSTRRSPFSSLAGK